MSCDFSCRECAFKGNDRHSLYNHRRKHHLRSAELDEREDELHEREAEIERKEAELRQREAEQVEPKRRKYTNEELVAALALVELDSADNHEPNN